LLLGLLQPRHFCRDDAEAASQYAAPLNSHCRRLHRRLADPGSNQTRIQCDFGPKQHRNRAILLGVLRQPIERVLIQIQCARAQGQGGATAREGFLVLFEGDGIGRKITISGITAAPPDRSCFANHEKLSCIKYKCQPQVSELCQWAAKRPTALPVPSRSIGLEVSPRPAHLAAEHRTKSAIRRQRHASH
jgi:hypothetical protein